MGITRRAQKHPYLYLPDGWDTGWKAAKAASGTTPCWMTAIGDSLTYGTGATTPATGSWYGLLRTALLARYSRYADYDQVFIDTVSTPNSMFSVSNASAFASVGYAVATASTGAGVGSVTYTTPRACTDLDIIYLDRIAGTWDWSLDGGAQTGTITQTATGAVKRKTFRGLSSGVHTVVCSNQSATQVLCICGGVTYSSLTSGVGYANMGVGSIQSSNWLPLANIRLLQGWQSSGSPTGLGFPAQPSLAFIGMGLNDMNFGNFGPAMTGYCISQMIESLRYGNPHCSIMLMAWSAPSNLYSDMATQAYGFAEDWRLWVQKMYELADTYTCAVANIHAKWEQSAVTNGYLLNGNVHPRDAGYADIANLLIPVL